MPNLADAALFLILSGLLQEAPPVVDPAPPIAPARSMRQGSLGYDTFDAEHRLMFRVTFTPVPGSDYGRPSDERVWEAERVRYLPVSDRMIETTTSLSCPGFIYVLEQMAALELGRFSVAGVTERPRTLGPQVRDGYTYRFHGPGLDPLEASRRLSVEGSSGQVRTLGQTADFQLKDCWRPQTED